MISNMKRDIYYSISELKSDAYRDNAFRTEQHASDEYSRGEISKLLSTFYACKLSETYNRAR